MDSLVLVIDYWLKLAAYAVGYTALAWFIMLALVFVLTLILYRTEE